MPGGWMISLAALWPNLLWMLFPARGMPHFDGRADARLPRVLETTERIGRTGVFIVPLFHQVGVSSPLERICVGIMMLALILYYVGWARYFLRGRNYLLLYKALFKMPVPLATSPVAYFGAASVVLHSAALATVAVLFGSSHIYLSYQESKRLGMQTSQRGSS